VTLAVDDFVHGGGGDAEVSGDLGSDVALFGAAADLQDLGVGENIFVVPLAAGHTVRVEL